MSTIVQRLASEADFTFAVDGGESLLTVTAAAGEEQLSRFYEFRVELSSEDAAIELTPMVGAAALLTLRGEQGPRYVHGVVRRVARIGHGVRQGRYSVELVPRHWCLTLRRKSRIFQAHNTADMSVPGIVRKVLEDAGFSSDEFRFALEEQHDAHDFVVQYRESDADFICRLLEREGLHFFFEHTADGHVMVITDGAVAHVPAPTAETLVYREPSGLDAIAECVYQWGEARQLRHGAVTLDAYNFKQPGNQLRVTRQDAQRTSLELYDYPGDYDERGDGERYADIRLEEQIAGHHIVELRTNSRGLLPGFRFTLTDHPLKDANREYLVVSVAHLVRQPQSGQEEHVADDGARYDATVRAIASDVPYRPPLRTPAPRVGGSQTALVVGPQGEEIWTDEYGRIKVQFHWDQEGVYDENSSCWIRVSQSWAGGQYGALFLPRVGQEVVVDFLEGNPARPIVTGSVYNNDNMPPCKLPDEKTRSTIKSRSSVGGDGVNEIRFEDRKDAEQLFLHAQRDFHTRARNDRVETVERDRHAIVERDSFQLVKQNGHTEVKLDLHGKVGGNHYAAVGGDVSEEIGGSHSEQTSGKYFLSAGGDIVLESSTGICLKVGGNFITINSSGVYIMGTVVHVNGTGSALNGSAIAAKAPAAPLEANTTEPGTDVTYNPDAREFAALEGAGALSGSDESMRQEKLTSWIEIELVDEAGRPCKGEAYEVIEPDGTKRSGHLNAGGQAHVAVSQPGTCEIGFPRLDYRAWGRTVEAPPPAAGDSPSYVPPPPANDSPGSPPQRGDNDSSQRPRWIPIAEGEVGVKEIAGDEDNPRVIEYHATTGGFSDDETPWCSSFVNWVMIQAGYSGTDSAQAISWANWGKQLDRPAYGAIAVIRWNDPPDTAGHVGFVVGQDGSNLQLLGGNQSDQVKVSSYGTDKIIAYVVPSDYDVPDQDYDLTPHAGPSDEGDFESTR